MPLVGLDPGEKTLGVAVSDVTRTVASPLALIEKTKFSQDAETLFKLMDSRGAIGIVVGLPMNMDGTEGVRCQSNRALARNLLRLQARAADHLLGRAPVDGGRDPRADRRARREPQAPRRGRRQDGGRMDPPRARWSGSGRCAIQA
jgi:hypothetical protein